MCVCLCVCNVSGKFGGQDLSSDAQPLYLYLYCVYMINQEADALKEHQLKQMQSGNSC